MDRQAATVGLGLALMLIAVAGCGILKAPMRSDSGEWRQSASRMLAADELWKEHDGAAGLYIDRGCVSETMSDYGHARRSWTIRCSVFAHTTAKGAESLFEYYRSGMESEASDVEKIGDATYLWKSTEARSWIVGFCRSRYFVEASLSVESAEEDGLTNETREALLEFARNLSQRLK